MEIIRHLTLKLQLLLSNQMLNTKGKAFKAAQFNKTKKSTVWGKVCIVFPVETGEKQRQGDYSFAKFTILRAMSCPFNHR